MPRKGLRQELRMQTRNIQTHVDVEINLTVDGRELPNLEVLGKALESATTAIQDTIKESYKVVPPRDTTPIAEPYKVS